MKNKWFKRDPRLGPLEWPAYLVDLYRVFPRALFIAATYIVYKIGWWYMYGILPAERTPEVSAFVAVVSGAWVKAMDYYMRTGTDWSKRMQINGGEYTKEESK